MNRRVLVTGSRTWSDGHIIDGALKEFCGPGDVIVHGHCPTGADAWAEFLWQGVIEQWPADWSKGKGAGFDRNQAMVNSSPALCLAFIRNQSKGATDCADRALGAGIPTVIYRRDDHNR